MTFSALSKMFLLFEVPFFLVLTLQAFINSSTSAGGADEFSGITPSLANGLVSSPALDTMLRVHGGFVDMPGRSAVVSLTEPPASSAAHNLPVSNASVTASPGASLARISSDDLEDSPGAFFAKRSSVLGSLGGTSLLLPADRVRFLLRPCDSQLAFDIFVRFGPSFFAASLHFPRKSLERIVVCSLPQYY